MFEDELTNPVLRTLFRYRRERFLCALQGLEKSFEIERVTLALENDALSVFTAQLGIQSSWVGAGLLVVEKTKDIVAAAGGLGARFGRVYGFIAGLALMAYAIGKVLIKRKMEDQETLSGLKNALASIQKTLDCGINQSEWELFKTSCNKAIMTESTSQYRVSQDTIDSLNRWLNESAKITGSPNTE
eukprot:TRINITY_DN4031_c0_g4_i1.p1 TRINITY_DN4031_c0_g4~~TRINITY_DN4031_c0_g4_i1.p1  ORF type:complete len:187 (+),score=12.97 TRINITY_DN4031_c0_g4_i1:365-925(+)